MTKINFNSAKMPLIILIVVCIGIRIISAIPWIPSASGEMQVTEMLRHAYQHPWETFFFRHVTPPLGFLANALVYDLGQPWSLGVMMLIMLACAATAAACLFLSCRALNVGVAISFVLTLGYSIVMMRVNQSSMRFNDDELIYTFLPLFIWKLILYLKEPDRRHGIHLGVISGLMIWISSVPGLVSLLITFMAAVFGRHPGNYLRRIGPVLIPFVLLLLLCSKNFYNSGKFNICTKGGQNGIQMIKSINGWTDTQTFVFARDEAAMPLWWQGCYANSANSFLSSGPSYGTCFAPTEEISLYPILMRLNEVKLAEKVLMDAHDYEKRPWIFYPSGASECARRFNAAYNAESQKAWFKFLLKHPATFISGAFTSPNMFFLYQGPLYGNNVSDFNGLRCFGVITKTVTFMMFPVLFGGIGVAYLAFLAFCFVVLLNIRKNNASTNSHLGSKLPIYLLGLGFVVSNFLFVIATCCENARMFWLAAPYLIPLAAFTIDGLIKMSNER